MTKYEPTEIESKWSEEWYKNNTFEATDFDAKPKKYILAELPYPSGKALHAGHMMRFTVPDIYSRYLRMKGYNVMFPMGWDAFGLPAENFAIKTGTHPAKLIEDTIVHYKKSIRRMGYGVDWKREVSTTDPKYYKWTQWIFLKFFKENLAQYKEMPIWWCEKLRTVLSDEEVVTDKNGNKVSEREGHSVVKKNIKQWILKITEYADKLIEGLDEVDFPESIKSAQKNWIGRKDGINIEYNVKDFDSEKITCFTTRPETNFGATFVVIAPDHAFVEQILSRKISVDEQTLQSIKSYVDQAKNKSEMERISEGRAKTGVFTGFYAINNLNQFEMPIWISDFVIGSFGTGALVGVPAHDTRDFEFATTFDLKIQRVIVGLDGDKSDVTDAKQVQEDTGVMLNSEFLDGLNVEDAKNKMMEHIIQNGWGQKIKMYSIRDWVFSRQRYWGEPIPLVHKENGEIEALCDPDDLDEVLAKLPLTLPEVPDYTPTSDGSSPLEKNIQWVQTKAKDGSLAKRETNTMPNWAGSCWYYIRYIDPNNDKAFADAEKLKYWLPVDRYFGGAEHTTLHLLYSRFWHRFLYEQGAVPTKEPYAWRMNGGTLLGPDGKRMSKTRGNVVEPMQIMDDFGADALRMYISFLGPYEETFPWNSSGIKATYRLLKTIYELKDKVSTNTQPDEQTLKMFHKMVKNITEMVENLKMNTSISELMIFVNHIKNQPNININIWNDLIKLLAPFAPFVAEDLWQYTHKYDAFNNSNSVHWQSWPKFDEKLAKREVKEIPVQINGKVRALVAIDANDTEETITQKLINTDKLKPYLQNKPIKKLIYLPEKIVNVLN